MSYVKKNLINGEEILYQASTHWFILIPSFFYGILGIFSLVFIALTAFLSLPITLFFFILSFSAALPYFVNELAMTNKRVISKKGFIRRDTSELKLSKLETIEIKQSVTSYGNVRVEARSGTKPVQQLTQLKTQTLCQNQSLQWDGLLCLKSNTNLL